MFIRRDRRFIRYWMTKDLRPEGSTLTPNRGSSSSHAKCSTSLAFERFDRSLGQLHQCSSLLPCSLRRPAPEALRKQEGEWACVEHRSHDAVSGP